jgi:hypothetical protein
MHDNLGHHSRQLQKATSPDKSYLPRVGGQAVISYAGIMLIEIHVELCILKIIVKYIFVEI